MSTTRELEMGLWRGERKCIDPKAGDADFWKKLGRIGSVNDERNTGGSGACQGAPHRKGQERDVAL